MKKLALGFILGLSSPAVAGTCALCRESLRTGGGEGLIKGFYWSILLILGVSLAVLGFAVRLGWRVYRKS